MKLAIRWHSRAGQGAITAATALAEILGTHGLCVQSFPEYGAEKRGAPVTVFNRLADTAIFEIGAPEAVDLVVLLDASLVASGEVAAETVLAGLKPDGQLLVNTAQTVLAFAANVAQVWTVDGGHISTAEIGKNIPNVPVLGALVALTGLLDEATFAAALEKYLGAGLPPPVVAGNLRALHRGWKEVRRIG